MSETASLPSLLRVVDLCTEFPGVDRPARAVDHVSFALQRGETLGIAGESGSGKTVTALSILRLVPSPPARLQGQVIFEGRNVLAMGLDELRSMRGGRIGMIFQDPVASLNPVISIGRQVAEALRAHTPMTRREAANRAIGFLEQVGVAPAPERARQYPHQLSGGMCQRVGIAIALANHPALLIADEATTALDVTVQAQILDLIRSVQHHHGSSLVMISHDLGVLAGMADRILVMYAGRIVESGPAPSLFASPRHPYTAALLACVPRVDGSTTRRAKPIPGATPGPGWRPEGCPFAPRCPTVQVRCQVETPPLAPAGARGEVACWFPLGSTLKPAPRLSHG